MLESQNKCLNQIQTRTCEYSSLPTNRTAFSLLKQAILALPLEFDTANQNDGNSPQIFPIPIMVLQSLWCLWLKPKQKQTQR